MPADKTTVAPSLTDTTTWGGIFPRREPLRCSSNSGRRPFESAGRAGSGAQPVAHLGNGPSRDGKQLKLAQQSILLVFEERLRPS